MSFLKGKRILVTRPYHQADSFVEQLTRLGAMPIIAPAIKVSSNMEDFEAQTVLDQLSSFDWVVFTSANGANFFIEALENRGELKKLKDLKIAAIGPKTADVLIKKIKKPDAMPEKYISTDMAATMGDVNGKNILLARASRASKILPKDLIERGAQIRELSVYDLDLNNDDVMMIEALKTQPKPDYLTFTSSSTVHGMKEILEKAERDWMKTVPSVAIGPVTAETLISFGITPLVIAQVYTIEGIIQALKERIESNI
jgi:uroporphyrinogen-III synthase